jgi:hypothetical protein
MKKPPSRRTAAFFRPEVLINIDKEPGTVIPRPPVTMMIFMKDEGMMSAVIVPVTVFVM